MLTADDVYRRARSRRASVAVVDDGADPAVRDACAFAERDLRVNVVRVEGAALPDAARRAGAGVRPPPIPGVAPRFVDEQGRWFVDADRAGDLVWIGRAFARAGVDPVALAGPGTDASPLREAGFVVRDALSRDVVLRVGRTDSARVLAGVEAVDGEAPLVLLASDAAGWGDAIALAAAFA